MNEEAKKYLLVTGIVILIVSSLLALLKIETKNFTFSSCASAPLSDQDFAKYLAERGDAMGAYIYASFIQQQKGDIAYGSSIDGEALKWLKIAAQRGSGPANDVLCSIFMFYKNIVGTGIPTPEEQPDWCYNAAMHGSKSAKIALAQIYEQGIQTKKNYSEAYFWSRLNSKEQQSLGQLTKNLTPDEIKKLEARISKWQPEEPIIRHPNMDISPWEGAYRSRLWPINIAGLICGGETQNCSIQDECGNMVGIFCPRNIPKYIIADKRALKEISSCPSEHEGCENLIPKTWSCGSLKNMPLSHAEQEKYPQYKNAISCGDVLGIDHNSAGDGPYEFVSKTTGEKLGECSFWQGKCTLPKEWTCGRPSNYGG